MADTKKVAEIAAQWWTDTIANPNPNSFCNGDRTSDSSFMIMMMGHMNALDHMASTEQLKSFNEILTDLIEGALAYYGHIDLDSDYGPIGLLAEAAAESGISDLLFPYKRHMHVTLDTVEVKDGYDADWKTIS